MAGLMVYADAGRSAICQSDALRLSFATEYKCCGGDVW